MYEVDKIEIVDEGSKGLFGFGARPVKVRLVVENMPDDPQRDEAQEGRSRGSNRGRGNRNQNRETRGGRPERSNNREGRGRNRDEKPRAERGNRDEKPRNERGNRDEKSRNGRGNRDRKPREARDETSKETPSRRSDNESTGQRNRNDRDRSRERGRNRGERPQKQENDRTPQGENETPPNTGRNKRTEGITEDIIEPITDAQGAEAATLLEEIITKMGIEAKAEFTRSEDGSARLNVSSEDSAILIGRKGRNLSSMQYLINRMISRGDTNENTERLVVDVEGYVNRRRESLQEMAKSMAERAKETKRNMRLKPLSPQERRIIHLTLEGD
ncbi:MAG: KH domain-containing protein, partial [Candidatus Hydrogenedentes bacterium]|nr:KH domain-containing protein [Candidatus Hydrogenedentota bacterium]